MYPIFKVELYTLNALTLQPDDFDAKRIFCFTCSKYGVFKAKVASFILRCHQLGLATTFRDF